MQLHKVKNIKGHIKGHMATRRSIEGDTCQTPAMAKANCEEKIDAALDRLTMGPSIRTWQGHILFAYPDCQGWCYWIDTFHTGYECTGYESREKAIENAYHHLAQNLWSLDVTDDRTFIAELPDNAASDMLSWMSWQRKYARLKSEGFSDEMAHKRASGF